MHCTASPSWHRSCWSTPSPATSATHWLARCSATGWRGADDCCGSTAAWRLYSCSLPGGWSAYEDQGRSTWHVARRARRRLLRGDLADDAPRYGYAGGAAAFAVVRDAGPRRAGRRSVCGLPAQHARSLAAAVSVEGAGNG